MKDLAIKIGTAVLEFFASINIDNILPHFVSWVSVC